MNRPAPQRPFAAAAARVLLPIGLLFASMPLRAAWYQVEVVIFEAVNPDADGEFWNANPGLPDTSFSTELVRDAVAAETTSAEIGLVPYRALDSSWFRLDGVFRTLRLTREYRPLLHVAWQQPGDGPAAERAVHLAQPREPAAAPSADPSLYAVPDPIVDGIVQLRVGRFLHLVVDMGYFPKSTPGPESAVAAPVSRRMQARRKVLLNDLNYFDHPLFGMLVQVSRLQAPEAETTVEGGQ